MCDCYSQFISLLEDPVKYSSEKNKLFHVIKGYEAINRVDNTECPHPFEFPTSCISHRIKDYCNLEDVSNSELLKLYNSSSFYGKVGLINLLHSCLPDSSRAPGASRNLELLASLPGPDYIDYGPVNSYSERIISDAIDILGKTHMKFIINYGRIEVRDGRMMDDSLNIVGGILTKVLYRNIYSLDDAIEVLMMILRNKCIIGSVLLSSEQLNDELKNNLPSSLSKYVIERNNAHSEVNLVAKNRIKRIINRINEILSSNYVPRKIKGNRKLLSKYKKSACSFEYMSTTFSLNVDDEEKQDVKFIFNLDIIHPENKSTPYDSNLISPIEEQCNSYDDITQILECEDYSMYADGNNPLSDEIVVDVISDDHLCVSFLGCNSNIELSEINDMRVRIIEPTFERVFQDVSV